MATPRATPRATQVDFPNNPSVNQTFTNGNQTWMWDGVKWIVQGSPSASSPYLPTAGGTVTGPLTVNGLATLNGGALGTTAAPNDNSTKLATTAYVNTAGLRNFLAGLNLTWVNATTVTINPGVAQSDDNAALMPFPTAMSKTLAAWSLGNNGGMLDTGTAGTSQYYHIFLIQRPDTGATDILASLSLASPTMPANYTRKRRIMAVITTATAGQMYTFTQLGDEVMVNPTAVGSFTVGTTAQTQGVWAPPGIRCPAHILVQALNPAVAAHGVYTPGVTAYYNMINPAGVYTYVEMWVVTDTNHSVNLISNTAGSTFNLYVLGWRDDRGRFN